MSDYLVVQHCDDARAWELADVGIAIPDDFRLIQGVRLKPDYPDDVVLGLELAGGNMKVDFLRNTDRIIVAGPRALEVLLANGVTEQDVELLPVSIRDKKGRILEERYTIVNPVVSVRCMDRARSVFETFEDGTDDVMAVDELYVTPDAIPPNLVLFRLGETPDRILVRDDLLKAIQGAKLTGFRAVPQGERLV